MMAMTSELEELSTSLNWKAREYPESATTVDRV